MRLLISAILAGSALALSPAAAHAQEVDSAVAADPFLTKFQSTFETPAALPAADFVPAESMEGPSHRVGSQAYSDGLHNTYFLVTRSGDIEVTGTSALLERIREIYALEHLRGISKTDEFTDGLKKSATGKLEGAAAIVRDPVGTIKKVPKGASRFFGRIGEGIKGGRSEAEAGSALGGLTGVSKARAKLAAQLGISPYTTNEELQRELTNVARASAGGGLVVSAATAAITGPASGVTSALGVNQVLQDTLINSTPEDLRIINRKKLLQLGVNRSVADEFLMHPWFSPWHETIITDALAGIGVNPTAFLDTACKALTPEDAFYFQRLALILAKYHAETPLKSIRSERGLVTALDSANTLVVPVSLDYGVWAERTARRVEEFTTQDRPNVKGIALWTDGRLSARLTEELSKRNIAFRMSALEAAHR